MKKLNLNMNNFPKNNPKGDAGKSCEGSELSGW